MKEPYFEKFGTLRIDLRKVIFYRLYYVQDNTRPYCISFYLKGMRNFEDSVKTQYLEEDKKKWEDAGKLLDKYFAIEKLTL